MTGVDGMGHGGLGHSVCLSFPLPEIVLLLEDAAMLEEGGESPWPASPVHVKQGGPPMCCLEVLREDSTSITCFDYCCCLSPHTSHCQPTGSPTLKWWLP